MALIVPDVFPFKLLRFIAETIASDIVKSHGGNIKLETSPTNGLRIKVILPF